MSTMAICWIGIGEYNILFDEFYKSFSDKFCTDILKTFFIFTDKPELYKDIKNSFIYEVSNACTLKEFVLFRKFKYLMMAEDKFLKYDYVTFINGNMVCKENVISEEVISYNRPLTVVTHPCYPINKCNIRNCDIKSCASFCPSENWIYKQGCFFVTTNREFLKMANTIEGWRHLDKANGNDKYVPWHDETYLNRYYYENRDKLNVLNGVIYAFPCDVGNIELFNQCKIYTRSKKDILQNFRPSHSSDLYNLSEKIEADNH